MNDKRNKLIIHNCITNQQMQCIYTVKRIVSKQTKTLWFPAVMHSGFALRSSVSIIRHFLQIILFFLPWFIRKKIVQSIISYASTFFINLRSLILQQSKFDLFIIKEVPWVVNNNHFDVKISYTIVLVIHYFCEKTAKSSTYMYMHKILTISNIFKHNSSSKQDLYNFVDLPTQYSCPLERRTVSLSLHDVVQFLRT